MVNHDTYLTPSEVVLRYKGKITVGCLANWRSKKQGPPFVKVGNRVLYPLPQLQDWEKQRTNGG